MTLRRAAKLPLTIGIVASALVVAIFYFSVQQDFAAATEETERVKSTLAATLASRTELRIGNEVSALELAARTPAMQSTDFAGQISEEFKGIPVDADPRKRAILKAILEEFTDFETASFVMANGDVYSVEPSELQQNLPTLNFAYRDYFVKTVETRQTYVSEVFRSTATDHDTIVISTPVFRDGELVGLLVGAMNLGAINTALQAIEFDANEVAVYIDRAGLEIASSAPREAGQAEARSVREPERRRGGRLCRRRRREHGDSRRD
ncbi:cache domain-containing protein [Candidatus Nitrososphaera sp. FF02]|uniref:cache domain-containing protein n=1 Tax=Candidatus Nitrososphaera sp. FF02 TaxID=3398226 RepID=UPI0039EB0A13